MDRSPFDRLRVSGLTGASRPYSLAVFLDIGNLRCYNADTLAEKDKGAEGE